MDSPCAIVGKRLDELEVTAAGEKNDGLPVAALVWFDVKRRTKIPRHLDKILPLHKPFTVITERATRCSFRPLVDLIHHGECDDRFTVILNGPDGEAIEGPSRPL